MKTILAIVALIGLAVVAEASCFKSKNVQVERPVPEVDLEGLSEYLVGKIPSNDTEANLGQLTKDLDSFSGPMRRAADLALEVSKVPADECSEDLKALIVRVGAAGLYVNGTSRVGQVVNEHLLSQLDTCENYFRQTFEERITADKDLIYLITNKVRCNGGCNERLLADRVRYLAGLEQEEIKCGELVVGEEKKTKKVVDEAKFNAAFNKYLVKPCEEWESKLGDIISLFESIREAFRKTPKYSYIYRTSGVLEATLGNRKFCDRVSNMDDILKSYMAMKLCF